MLEQGDDALKAGRLLTPIDDCAYDYYREALVVAPDHPAALHGLQRVAERYVGMAEQAAESGQFDTARSMLEHARIVDPRSRQHRRRAKRRSNCAAPRNAITSRSTPSNSSSRSAELSAQLKTLGAKAKAHDAWVIIRARNDAEGRWIYQQMADAPGDRRIRAELTLGAPPGVDLLQLNADTSDRSSE